MMHQSAPVARAPDGSLSQWRTWQSDGDRELRKDILTRIYTQFKQKAGGKENARLLQYARRVEEELYRRAQSMAHYQDPSTLTTRLSEVIKALNGKAAQNGVSHSVRRPPVASMPDNVFRSGTAAAGPSASTRALAPGPTMIPAPSVSQTNPARGAHVESSSTPAMIATPGLDPMSAQRPAGAHGWAPMGTENGWGQRQPGAGPMPMFSTVDPAHSPGDSKVTVQGHNVMAMSAPQQMPGHGMKGTMSSASVPHLVNHSAPVADTQARERLQKQQRLLMFLRHCAKCRVSNCPYGPNCETGKQLWNHITSCRDQQCSYPRCVHARDLLRHYQKCRRHDCPICEPIRHVGVDGSRSMSQPGGQPRNGVMPHDANSNGNAPIVPQPSASAVPANGMLVPAPSTSTMTNSQSRGQTRVREEAPQDIKEEDGQNLKRSKQHLDHIKSKLGASLLETFDIDQLEDHVQSCQTEMETFNLKAKGELCAEADMCTICKAKTVLFFEPTPKECAACHCRIKKLQHYYQSTTPQAIWCAPCFQSAGETIRMGASTIKKDTVSNAIKKRNAETQAEPWVCCDGCNRWVHMLCGLFNKGNNKEDTKFLCPWCLQDQQRMGTWTPIKQRPQSMLSAEELPRTELSDHMEQYLSLRLEEEYQQRKSAANGGDIPPMVTGLTIRAVNITRKETEVKPKYYEAFRQTHSYPQRFPFTQKVILVFQQIEGVDVLIFVVYVQEYGEDAPAPNRNTVYLAYLDSVKHFRPEEKDAGGTALRTMVYHEVLLAYIDRAAMLGMNSIYIWSCPPLAGDDYVLYCHPPKQKNPKADKLRDWYHSLCEKGINRELMVMRSTIFDRFMLGGKHNAMMEPSTTMLPYFDGDYWPGDAENQLAEMEKGVATGQSGKKGSKARANGGKGKRMNVPLTTDGQLGQRLAESSLGSHQGNMINDFIIAHLRTPCSMCPEYCDKVKYVLNKDKALLPKPESRGKSFDGIQLAVDGAERCDIPKYFACCTACFQAAQQAERQGAQPKLPKQVSTIDLEPQECRALGKTIEDKDQLMDCDIFDARTSFLSLCQSQFLQFDTLRRAKHSTMMTLYHLHNPDQEMMSTTCTNCGGEIQANQGWRCKECADYELCSTCYQAGHGRNHPHPLMRPTVDNHFQQALTQEQRRMRADTLRRTMVLLEHAAVCQNPNCQSKSCHKVKQLHAHSKQCNKRTSGNCNYCRHLWCLLGLHAKRCTKGNCPVPRCNELRKARRQQASQADEDRRKRYFQSQQQQRQL